MTTPAPVIRHYFYDANGNPATNAQLYTYVAGGAVSAATFQDVDGLVPNTNPILLDAAGSCRLRLVTGGSYRFVLVGANSVQIFDEDFLEAPPSQAGLADTVFRRFVISAYAEAVSPSADILIHTVVTPFGFPAFFTTSKASYYGANPSPGLINIFRISVLPTNSRTLIGQISFVAGVGTFTAAAFQSLYTFAVGDQIVMAADASSAFTGAVSVSLLATSATNVASIPTPVVPVPPPSATTDPTNFLISGSGAGLISSPTMVCVPSGITAPTFSWFVFSGAPLTIDTPAAVSTSFSTTGMSIGEVRTTFVRCTVSGLGGPASTPLVQITFNRTV